MKQAKKLLFFMTTFLIMLFGNIALANATAIKDIPDRVLFSPIHTDYDNKKIQIDFKYKLTYGERINYSNVVNLQLNNIEILQTKGNNITTFGNSCESSFALSTGAVDNTPENIYDEIRTYNVTVYLKNCELPDGIHTINTKLLNQDYQTKLVIKNIPKPITIDNTEITYDEIYEDEECDESINDDIVETITKKISFKSLNFKTDFTKKGLLNKKGKSKLNRTIKKIDKIDKKYLDNDSYWDSAIYLTAPKNKKDTFKVKQIKKYLKNKVDGDIFISGSKKKISFTYKVEIIK